MATSHTTFAVATTQQTILALTGLSGSRFKTLTLQAVPANTTVVYGGGQSVLTTTNAGFIIPAPVTSVPAPPLYLEDSSLAEIKVLSTVTTQKLMATVIYP